VLHQPGNCPIFAGKKLAPLIHIGISNKQDTLSAIQNLFSTSPDFLDTTATHAMDGLLKHELELAILSLHQIPVERDQQLAIAALTARIPGAYTLVIHPDALQKKAVFKLEKGISVLTDSWLAHQQLLHYRPDLQVALTEAPSQVLQQQLKTNTCAALLLPHYRLEEHPADWQGFVQLRLHPREFVPEPGLGVPAFLVRAADTDYRKKLLPLHDTAVAEQTQVERKVLQLLPKDMEPLTGVYCSKDEAGNYHVWAVQASPEQAKCRFVQVSSSTTFELEVRVVEALNASQSL